MTYIRRMIKVEYRSEFALAKTSNISLSPACYQVSIIRACIVRECWLYLCCITISCRGQEDPLKNVFKLLTPPPPSSDLYIHQWIESTFVQITAPNHYLRQCWNIVNCSRRNKLQGSFNQNVNFSSRRCSWKYRLRNGCDFVQGMMS